MPKKPLPIRLSGHSDDLIHYRDETGNDKEIGTFGRVTFALTVNGIEIPVVMHYGNGWEVEFPTATALRKGTPRTTVAF